MLADLDQNLSPLERQRQIRRRLRGEQRRVDLLQRRGRVVARVHAPGAAFADRWSDSADR